MAYTNSPLISYTKLSPNHSGQRTHSIDRITPHCVVGQLSAESICGCFTSTDRQASCNYGIGTDGRISLCVEEKNRSWCSSSNANDQRAITIECASDSTAPYAMNSSVYNSLINLCVDICKRNGKKKLLWFADKNKTLNYNPASDEMVLTVHRWFANKSCPGDWLYNRLSDLASQVTAKLGGTSQAAATNPKSDEETIWNTLFAFIGNAYGTAGLMGNLYAESALRSNNLQNSYNKKLNITDEEYTKVVDEDAYPNFVTDKAGYGLAQWTYYSRKQALLNYAKAAGKSIGNLEMQLDFLCEELKGYSTVLNALKSATSVREASDVVLTKFERPADQSEAVQVKRAGYGQVYYDKYADNSAAPSTPASSLPYRVCVSINDLNIRKGPGTDNAKTGRYTGKGIFTIVAEADGQGASKWGKLKSGAGWIALNYTERV